MIPSVPDSPSSMCAVPPGRADVGDRSRPTVRAACRLALLTLVGGCAAPSADLAGFGRAASTIQTEAAATFAEANRVARGAEADRFVRSGAIALSEELVCR